MREVARCLKPGGTFATFVYHLVGASGNPAIDAIIGSLDAKSHLSPSDTSPTTKIFYESYHSHYDNIDLVEKDFSDETRYQWNTEGWIFFRQSDSRAVDRRHTESAGFQEIYEPLNQ